MTGLFITFEGGEGAGKSTQIKALADKISKLGHEVVLTREPGGSKGAEILRHVLLSGAAEPFGPQGEILLFAAARLDHMTKTIMPALSKDAIVLCDRFYDSTRAYQGSTDAVNADLIGLLEDMATKGRDPDLTLILDIDPEIGLSRVASRLEENKNISAKEGVSVDRFEKDDLAVHQKRREAFLKIAADNSERCRIINAEKTPQEIERDIWKVVEPLVARLDNVSDEVISS